MRNAKYFDKTRLKAATSRGALSAFDDSWLRARCFDERGHRTGGIVNPRQVTIGEGALIIRSYGGKSPRMGQWWLTPYELRSLLTYVGRNELSEGRNKGSGALHAFLAILSSEWQSTCEFFTVAALSEPLLAFYGEGDHAVFDATGGQKAARLFANGRQRGMRQIFLPNIGDYESAMNVRAARGSVDNDLISTLQRLPKQRLDFES